MVKRTRWVTFIAWLGASSLVLFFGFPLLWVLLGGLTGASDLAAGRSFVAGAGPTLSGYRSVLNDPGFWAQLRNSAVCGTICSLLAVGIGSSVAYLTTRRSGGVARALASLSLASYMVSPVVLAVPFFVVWTKLGLSDSLTGIVIAHLSFALPYGIWSMRGFFAGLPISLEERAASDGLSPGQVLALVILPTIVPGALTTTLFCFLLSWNDYVFARVLNGSERLKTLPVGIDDMFQGSLVDWTRVLAAGTITMVPALLIVAFLQRQFGRSAIASLK